MKHGVQGSIYGKVRWTDLGTPASNCDVNGVKKEKKKHKFADEEKKPGDVDLRA
jgi:hypothetical protein